jgi:hypothetical protein
MKDAESIFKWGQEVLCKKCSNIRWIWDFFEQKDRNRYVLGSPLKEPEKGLGGNVLSKEPILWD